MIGAISTTAAGSGQITTRSPAGQHQSADFDSVLADVVTSLRTTLDGAETAAAGGIQGAVPAQEVVGRLLEAERSLQMVLAVRDKAVAAYLEINRMQI